MYANEVAVGFQVIEEIVAGVICIGRFNAPTLPSDQPYPALGFTLTLYVPTGVFAGIVTVAELRVQPAGRVGVTLVTELIVKGLDLKIKDSNEIVHSLK